MKLYIITASNPDIIVWTGFKWSSNQWDAKIFYNIDKVKQESKIAISDYVNIFGNSPLMYAPVVRYFKGVFDFT